MKKTITDKEIDDFKKKIIEQAEKNGVSENLGAKEIYDLKVKHGYDPRGSFEERLNAAMIDFLEAWCMNFDLEEVY